MLRVLECKRLQYFNYMLADQRLLEQTEYFERRYPHHVVERSVDDGYSISEYNTAKIEQVTYVREWHEIIEVRQNALVASS